jgi:type II secretory pathway pseudopilin PulG
MSLLIKYLLTTQYKRRYNHQASGFTMIELLVAAIMSFLIITPILTFAVSILNDDVKEQAKASTELELQSALDYMQQDISQAFYIYDGAGITALTTPTNQLPTVTNGQPVLVFWKREIIPNAINVTVNDITKDKCDDVLDPTGICDDVYAESLVAYYLVKETDDKSKWCQPGGGNCPARIERWSIRDGAKRINGTYLCGDDGVTGCDDDKYKRFKRSKGFNSYNYDADTTNTTDFPLSWTQRTGEGYEDVPQVLVNYIDRNTVTGTANFCLNSLGMPTAQPSPAVSPPLPMEDSVVIGGTVADKTPTFQGFSGCVNTAGNIAKISIRGDALRRNEARNADCTGSATYCPTVSGQISGGSRFGQ